MTLYLEAACRKSYRRPPASRRDCVGVFRSFTWCFASVSDTSRSTFERGRRLANGPLPFLPFLREKTGLFQACDSTLLEHSPVCILKKTFSELHSPVHYLICILKKNIIGFVALRFSDLHSRIAFPVESRSCKPTKIGVVFS